MAVYFKGKKIAPVNNIYKEELTLTVTPQKEKQNIKPSSELQVYNEVIVEATPLETTSVAPTTEQQVITPTEAVGLSEVTVEAVDSSIDENIQPSNIKKDITILGVTGDYEPNLQSKEVTITTNGTSTIAPDTGYDGLNNVKVTTNVDSSSREYPTIDDVRFTITVIDAVTGDIIDQVIDVERGYVYTLPTAPTHTNFTFNKWVCAQAITDNTVTVAYQDIVVGAHYTYDLAGTATVIDIEISRTMSKTFSIKLTAYTNSTIDWGDGTIDTVSTTEPTHTYSDFGSYTIRVDGDSYTFGRQTFSQVASGTAVERSYYVESIVLGSNASFSAYTFAYCYNLKSVIMPYKIVSGDYLFCYCYRLTTVLLPDVVNSLIPSYCFNYSYSLKSIVIPSEGIKMNYGTFANSGCEYVALPLVYYGSYSFSGSALKSVCISREETQGMFLNCNNLVRAYVPKPTGFGPYFGLFGSCLNLKYVIFNSVAPASSGSRDYFDFNSEINGCVNVVTPILINSPTYAVRNGDIYTKIYESSNPLTPVDDTEYICWQYNAPNDYIVESGVNLIEPDFNCIGNPSKVEFKSGSSTRGGINYGAGGIYLGSNSENKLSSVIFEPGFNWTSNSIYVNLSISSNALKTLILPTTYPDMSSGSISITAGCVEEVDLHNIPATVNTVYVSGNMLKKVILPPSFTGSSFSYSSNVIKEIVMPVGSSSLITPKAKSVTRIAYLGNVSTGFSIGYDALYTPSLREYDLTNCVSVPLQSSSLPYFKYAVNYHCKIIVPDSLYSQWIVATNWITIADYIYKESDVRQIELPYIMNNEYLYRYTGNMTTPYIYTSYDTGTTETITASKTFTTSTLFSDISSWLFDGVNSVEYYLRVNGEYNGVNTALTNNETTYTGTNASYTITTNDDDTSTFEISYAVTYYLSGNTTSVTKIHGNAFKNNTTITSINIPSGITQVGMGCFSNCSALVSVIIPDTVTSLAKNVFDECVSLTSVTLNAQTIVLIDSDAFAGVTVENLTIYVPSTLLEDYKSNYTDYTFAEIT